jgi:hypothetical protein
MGAKVLKHFYATQNIGVKQNECLVAIAYQP